MRIALALLACGAACGADRPAQPLGLNDVSVLVPLAAATSAQGMVPPELFDRLVTGPGDVLDPYAAFRVVAIRFELCDRVAAGPCPDGDGRLRLVLQPVRAGASAEVVDVALHASYRFPPVSSAG